MKNMNSEPSGSTFVDTLNGEQRQTYMTRLAFYRVLAAWEAPPSPELPARRDLTYIAGKANSTFTTHFGTGQHPRLQKALGEAREPVDRCVLEAKEFTAAPWLLGWATKRRELALSPRDAAETLLRTVTAWAATHRSLAAMNHGEIPPTMRTAAAELSDDHGPGVGQAFSDLVHEALLIVAHDPEATPLTVLNRLRGQFLALEFGSTDALHRSLELAAHIGHFMIFMQEVDGDADPELLDIMALALSSLRPQPGELPS